MGDFLKKAYDDAEKAKAAKQCPLCGHTVPKNRLGRRLCGWILKNKGKSNE